MRSLPKSTGKSQVRETDSLVLKGAMQNNRILQGPSSSSHHALATASGEVKSDPTAVAGVGSTQDRPAPSPGSPPVWLRYFVAVGCVLCALGTRLLLAPVLGDELPFLLLIAASLVAAWYGGIVPGAASLLLGLVVGDYFFVPGNPFRWSDPKELAHLLRYLFTASLGIALLEVLHRANRRTQAALQDVRHENALRRRSEEALLQAKDQLVVITTELEKRVAERTAELSAHIESLRGVQYHMVHHLRAPLRAMRCYTTLLVEEYGSKLDATALSYCTHVSEAATRMDRLILDLMEYCQLGHETLSCAQISFAQPLHRAIDRLAGEMRSRNARIELTGPWPSVYADRAAVEKILFNLLQNALRFVAPAVAPLIRVWPERRGSRLRVWAEDNGIGVRPEHHQLIFQPFETLHPSHVFGGNGMGLAIVKQSVCQMGGDVGLESPSSGGSRFWIELPTAPPEPKVVAEQRIQQAPSEIGADCQSHRPPGRYLPSNGCQPPRSRENHAHS